MEFANISSLVAELRSGSPEAAGRLVVLVQPYLRQLVHMRLTSPALRRHYDTADICQSVLAQLLERAATGRVELVAEKLTGLLAVMARHKLIDKLRRCSLVPEEAHSRFDPAVDSPGPAELASGREMVESVRCLLSERERWLWEQRVSGRSWPEIAGLTGQPAATLRITFVRAMARVRRELASLS